MVGVPDLSFFSTRPPVALSRDPTIPANPTRPLFRPMNPAPKPTRQTPLHVYSYYVSIYE